MWQSGFPFRLARFAGTVAVVCFASSVLQPASVRGQSEFRAFWVDAFHAGFKSSAEVTTLVDNIRSANCNAVVVEVRKRGDAYYTPDPRYADYEPHAMDTSPANFDSLADLISKAHDVSGGKARIEVHVWLVTWPIWGGTTPPSDPQHPYNRHPEWLTQDYTGATYNGQNYCFDPGHPGAFEHTFRIAMNLVTNYDIDGLNFDYVRYAGNTWGYNPTAVSRFHARYGGSGNPAPANPYWLQFRRDQVTAFVRKVYLNTLACKPNVKVSADTVTWAPGPATPAGWYASAAWTSVLQDWRGWMEEGILDLNIPMAYFNQAGAYTTDWTNWCNFIRDNQYQRQAVIGAGVYLNATADAITQLRYARSASPAGNSVCGVCGYSYAVPDARTTPFATFLRYLTNSPNAYDSVTPALFGQAAAIPAMPWKTSPSKGHIMGAVYCGSLGSPADGAVVTISGPGVARSQTNDATGFFGFVDLPPGPYELQAQMSGFGSVSNTISVSAGVVTNVNLTLSVIPLQPPVILEQPRDLAAVAGGNASFSVSASSPTPLRYQWFFNGVELANQADSTLSLSPVKEADFGSYTVRLSNTDGAVLSDAAGLRPATAPSLSAQGDGSRIQIGFATEPGPTYSLEYNNNPAGSAWETLTNVPGVGGAVTITDLPAPHPARFYRVWVR